MNKNIVKNNSKYKRMLDMGRIREPSSFVVFDENYNIVSENFKTTNGNLIYGDNFIGLKEGQTAHFYNVILREDICIRGSKDPMPIEISGCPDWKTIKYLVEEKKLTLNGAIQLYYTFCEDCMNELINFVARKPKYQRTGITKCQYCIDVDSHITNVFDNVKNIVEDINKKIKDDENENI